MATPKAAIGTQLWVGDGQSPETFFKVAKVQDIDGPGMTRSTIDVTTHDTDDQYMDFIASLKDGGEVVFPLVFDPNESTHNETATSAGAAAGGLKYLYETGEKRNMRIVAPTSPTTRLRYVGLITAFKPNFKVLGAIAANVTIKVSKKPVLEQGTGTSA